MEFLKKAAMDRRIWRNYMVKISLVGTVSLAGLVLSVVSIFAGRYLFALWYLVAFCLGFSYVVIRINTIFPTYLAADGEKLILSTWNNGVFPYRVGERAGIISDFIPEKVKTSEILFSDIEKIYIGSKRLMKKVLSPEEYPDGLSILEEDRHNDAALKKMDFVLVSGKSGETCFMSVTDFDMNELSEVIDVVERNCQGVKILIHLPRLLRLRKKNI